MNDMNREESLLLSPDTGFDDPFGFGAAPVMGRLQGQTASKGYRAGSVDENMLTPEEKQMIEQFVTEIDITNSKHVLSYGAAAQRNISDFSVDILNKVKNRDLGEVGAALQELTVSLNATTEPVRKGIAGLFKKAKKGVDAIKANYAKAETNVQRIERDLESHQVVLMQDVSMFEQMYELNLQYYRDLTLYIIAGKKALELAKQESLAYYKEKAERTQLPEDVQAYYDYMNMCKRFEKKLHDLELTRTITIQSAPQIRMIQNNDEEMLEKIQSSIINTIPLWRHQMVLALGIEHSRNAVAAQSEVTETTNKLLEMNAATLRQATVATAKESEKSIVNIETLKKCNQELISSINEVVKVHEDGSRKRQAAQEELLRIEKELKQTLLSAGSRM